MIEVQNITDDPFQRHVITTPDGAVTLLLRFYPRTQFWTLSIEYKEKIVNGLKLSLGTLHARSQNLPFDFIVADSTGVGIDPFTIEDFSNGRCRLVMLQREDMEEIRGQSVPI